MVITKSRNVSFNALPKEYFSDLPARINPYTGARYKKTTLDVSVIAIRIISKIFAGVD